MFTTGCSGVPRHELEKRVDQLSTEISVLAEQKAALEEALGEAIDELDKLWQSLDLDLEDKLAHLRLVLERTKKGARG